MLQSQPAIVRVNVVGRPDPSKDPEVIGLIGAEIDSARRFGRAQLWNFQWRLETLHRTRKENSGSGSGKKSAIAAAPWRAAAAMHTRCALCGTLPHSTTSDAISLGNKGH